MAKGGRKEGLYSWADAILSDTRFSLSVSVGLRGFGAERLADHRQTIVFQTWLDQRRNESTPK